MTEKGKAELLRRKAMLFQFLDFQRRNKENFWGDEEEYQILVDEILDQINRINRQLLEILNQ